MTVTAERRLLPLRWVLVVATVTVFAVSLLVVVAAWLGGAWLAADDSTPPTPPPTPSSSWSRRCG